ncbi:M16 family metallopeptidase [Marinibacterium profundimaris]|uniref:Zinc protease n=1 Tax=Marinibacterium profundimaris TaxID=1679460 RepID=A0A225NNM7_9RHOB|nr:pitrilysin family protein [Marinibacterium profundimaris]OWU76081.1 zinc protease [Marinibacterium profundimaris]
MKPIPAFFSALAVWLAALPAALAAQDVSDQVTTFTLDNGMEVVVVEDHRAPVVQQMVWYRAGAADEAPGVSGVAHFLEHLLFKATDTLEAGELSATVAANGGSDNAFTSYDYTAYYQQVAADRLGLMMEMEADRMKNIRLTETDIATERDVILEERNMRIENSTGALFSEQLSAAQYLNHPYGIPVIGWRHEMAELDMDAVMDFYELYYSPNNAILVVTGDVTADEVRTLAEETYGKIPANPELTERSRPQEPPQTAPRRLVFEDPRVAQPTLRRSYLAPERDPGDQRTAAALDLLSEVLGGGQTSYLNERLQFEEKSVVYAGSFYSGTSLDDTTFNLVVVPVPDVTLEEAEASLDAAIAQFMEDGVDPEHLERIKAQKRAAQIYERDSVDSVGNRYGRALASGLTVEDIQAWPGLVQEITADEVMEAARMVFRPETSVTGYLTRPQTPGETEQTEQEVTQ